MRPVTGRQLRAWVREDFGVDLGLLDEVRHGADEAAQLWRATSTSDGRYAVKLSGGGTPAGLLVTDHLARYGVPGIAGPVRTRDGRLWSARDGRRLSLAPWVSDHRALDGGMTAGHWAAYGALLARVHATPVTEELAAALPRESHTHERARSLHQLVERRIGAGPADDLAEAMVRRWHDAAGQVRTLLDQADALGGELRGRPEEGVVCHGDPHLGNLLLGEDGRDGPVWLVDWDDAVLAPPERDLMFVTGGVLAFAPVTGPEQEWFFDGYGPVETDRTRLAYYMCVRAMEDLFDFAAHVLDARDHAEAERAEALSIVDGLLSPAGLVTLAIASLREIGRTSATP
ncbi:MAG TPA: phosphotransferase [Micromonosporaceae bacterium]|nr:phosphotransferase [Micromonosporaceae bacterium]